MLMEFDHGPDCWHCARGCQHPHDEHEPPGLHVGPEVPSAPADLIPTGGKGAVIGRDGLTLASNRWHPIVCVHCGRRAMTPIEAIPFRIIAAHDHDGNILSRCGPCKADIRDGYKPGMGPYTARTRRRRH